ncbi:unnamed protein product [Dicrocoelium dendriticum]|nr:unnamed protein product [Dicrocoelium dendriticum]
MDSEVDLSELDDWLGTLEELQLGLDKNKTTWTSERSANTNSTIKQPSNPFSNVNQTFLGEPQSPRHCGPPPTWGFDMHLDPMVMRSKSPVRLPLTNPLTNEQRQALQSSKIVPQPINPKLLTNGREQLGCSLSGRHIKEAAVERDLSCLLRDLELVEQRMKELEQSGNTFTRRYSLASSPSSDQPAVTAHLQSCQRHVTREDDTRIMISQPTGDKGFISAQWAAELNRDRPYLSPPFPPSDSPSPSMLPKAISQSKLTALPPPPASFGAGDACVSTPNSPPPLPPSASLQNQTDVGFWLVRNNISQYPCSQKITTNDERNDVDRGQSIYRNDFERLASPYEQFDHSKQPISNASQPRNERITIPTLDEPYHGRLHVSPDDNPAYLVNSAQSHTSPAGSSSRLLGKTSCEMGHRTDEQHPVAMVHAASHGHSHSLVTKDVDEDGSLSDFSSCSRSNPAVGFDSSKTHTLSPREHHLLNSFSPESSLSGNSLPEHPPCRQTVRSPWCSTDTALVKKAWLGKEFAELHRYTSADAVQLMLSNIEQTGFPEWKDYLYIRKPGEKTWSRRLCILRSSGIYTSKKNKKNLSSTDLIRILVLDEKLQLYTTTGGWTRLRAPTPHGFAFKPYSAQDPTSMNVFCFCATDDGAMRQWVCRLRIAKHGRQLYTNYQNSLQRVRRLMALRYTSGNGPNHLNGSLSACLQRKSSFDIISSSTPSTLSAPERSESLSIRTGSPALERRSQLKQTNYQNHLCKLSSKMDLSVSTHPCRCFGESVGPVSPLLPRIQRICTHASLDDSTQPIYR